MELNKIRLYNFRSYSDVEFEFARDANLILGPNGSGKTNLMEAIAYTSIGKSVRYHLDNDLLRNGEESFAVDAVYSDEESIPLRIQLSYQERKKLLKINSKIAGRLSELFSLVKVIYSAPEDILLINGGPSLRRQYFDLAIAQLFPDYLEKLRNYLQAVDQRNKLLKTEFDPQEKRAWDKRFIATLLELYPYREKYLNLVNDVLKKSLEKEGSSPDFTLSYDPVQKEAFGRDEQGWESSLKSVQSSEIKWQRSMIGAHLDDYLFEMQSNNMRSFASQGQKRMAVIRLKAAQAQLIETHTGIKPILLFDDIFAELDERHSHQVRSLIDPNHQIFIASPNKDIEKIFNGAKVISL